MESYNNIFFHNGGDKISEGGYGCVYHPGLKCDGSEMKNRKYISKIQIDDYAGNNEISISNMIRKIPIYKDFFVPIKSFCKLNKTEMTDGMIKRCEPLKNKKGKDVLLMKMDYIEGDTLYKYLASIQSPKQLIHEIIHTYNYLTQSISLLLKHGIVHYDLKSPNIMYSSSNNTPYIIDFGLSILVKDLMSSKTKLRNIFYVYAPDYYIWCPEIHILNYIINIFEGDRLGNDTIKNICKEVVSHNRVYKKIYTREQIKVYEDALIKYYIDKNKEFDGNPEKFMDFLIDTYDTWDNYSLSIMYLKILLLIDEKSVVYRKTKTHSDFIYLFSQLLVNNLSFDPLKRLNVVKLDEYMLLEMIKHKNQHDGIKSDSLTENYIDGFINVLQDISNNHDQIQKSLRLEEEEIQRVSKSIERTK
jgi:serine/threonine protein kinase